MVRRIIYVEMCGNMGCHTRGGEADLTMNCVRVGSSYLTVINYSLSSNRNYVIDVIDDQINTF